MASKPLIDAAKVALAKLRKKVVKAAAKEVESDNRILLAGSLASGDRPQWTYDKVKWVSITDGDTINLEIDLGFNIRTVQKLRIDKLDLPESNTSAGVLSRLLLTTLFSKLYIRSLATTRKDKYGRYLCAVDLDVIGDLQRYLVNKKCARLYSGEKREAWGPAELTTTSTAIRAVLSMYGVKVD